MNKIILFFLALTFATTTFAQEKLYNPYANADSAIKAAVKQAKSEGKYVILQGGGNWCKWCIEFARFIKADPKLDSVMNNSFVWYHLNYSKENDNKKTFAKYDFPQRFGYPVFIILDGNGKRIHTQNSEYLEDGKQSYNKAKVQAFLEMWSPRALNPKMYGSDIE